MKPFPKRAVTITLTGEQWVTILSRLIRRDLSPKGERVYHTAAKRMNKQLIAAGKLGPVEKETQS